MPGLFISWEYQWLHCGRNRPNTSPFSASPHQTNAGTRRSHQIGSCTTADRQILWVFRSLGLYPSRSLRFQQFGSRHGRFFRSGGHVGCTWNSHPNNCIFSVPVAHGNSLFDHLFSKAFKKNVESRYCESIDLGRSIQTALKIGMSIQSTEHNW